MEAFWKSLIFVFLSEMGDKTQIVSFALGAEIGVWTVLLGVFIAVALLMLCTVAIGVSAGHLIPTFWINILAGIIFLVFAGWTLRSHDEEDSKTIGKKFGPLIAVIVTFFIAELGDKTVIASIAMGSQHKQYFPVWAGSTIGMYLADVIAIVSGRVLGKQLPEKLMRYGSAFIFAAAGIYTLVDAFMHR